MKNEMRSEITDLSWFTYIVFLNNKGNIPQQYEENNISQHKKISYFASHLILYHFYNVISLISFSIVFNHLTVV